MPVGATIIPQTRGTAPGLICPVGDKVVYAVPGVPHEMQEMLERAVLPDLRRRSGDTSVIASRVLRTWGESESGLDERLRRRHRPGSTTLGNPTLAFLASGWRGIKVRLTAKAATAADADRRCCRAGRPRSRDAARRRSCSASTTRRWSRSCSTCCASGGSRSAWPSRSPAAWSAARLTSVAGASDVFRGSIVTYASEVKFDVLGVPEGPVVTPEAAAAMAVGAQRVLGADVGLALTGVAGPTEQDGQPVGTLHVGLATRRRRGARRRCGCPARATRCASSR